MSEVRVYLEYYIVNTSLPDVLDDKFRQMFDDYEYSNGERIPFESFREYLTENELDNEVDLLDKFMKNYHLEDNYCIDLSW